MTNIYTKYKISKSLNGDKIVYLARVGKQQKLIMRANSESELVTLMAAEAKRLDDEQLAQQRVEHENKERLAGTTKKKKKKVSTLWKPGKLLKNDDGASPQSDPDSGLDSDSDEPVHVVEDLS